MVLSYQLEFSKGVYNSNLGMRERQEGKEREVGEMKERLRRIIQNEEGEDSLLLKRIKEGSLGQEREESSQMRINAFLKRREKNTHPFGRPKKEKLRVNPFQSIHHQQQNSLTSNSTLLWREEGSSSGKQEDVNETDIPEVDERNFDFLTQILNGEEVSKDVYQEFEEADNYSEPPNVKKFKNISIHDSDLCLVNQGNTKYFKSSIDPTAPYDRYQQIKYKVIEAYEDLYTDDSDVSQTESQPSQSDQRLVQDFVDSETTKIQKMLGYQLKTNKWVFDSKNPTHQRPLNCQIIFLPAPTLTKKQSIIYPSILEVIAGICKQTNLKRDLIEKLKVRFGLNQSQSESFVSVYVLKKDNQLRMRSRQEMESDSERYKVVTGPKKEWMKAIIQKMEQGGSEVMEEKLGGDVKVPEVEPSDK